MTLSARSLAPCLLAAAAALAGAARAEERMPFAACITDLRAGLPSKVSAASFETYTRDAQDMRPAVDTATTNQPEFTLAIWDYQARLVDEQRIADGREVLRAEREPLGRIASRSGVEPETLVAVYGVETDYGRIQGRHPVVDATLSRACLAPQNRERRQQFYDALWLLQEGIVRREQFLGSWAGAFGKTQFMPSTFVAYMADADGSGPADIYESTPDALATTARFLTSLGWKSGLPWGVEVRAPAAAAALAASASGHACLAARESGPACRSVDGWARLGVERIDGTALTAAASRRELPGDARAALLMPAGPEGPAWLVTPNFRALWRYNRADAYALAIGRLADALAGRPATVTPWPTDDPGLSRGGIRRVQELLIARGHADLQADGRDGPLTREAIRAEEARLGWAPTGRAGGKLLRALEAAPSAADGAPPAAPAAPASPAS